MQSLYLFIPPTLQDGFINDTKWKKEKDIHELLTKVKRKIKLFEFKGTSTISRTD